jgi:hypothetical protein
MVTKTIALEMKCMVVIKTEKGGIAEVEFEGLNWSLTWLFKDEDALAYIPLDNLI